MFQQNVTLSRHSSYKIGGAARYFFEPKNEEELISAISQARKLKTDLFVLGAGTNVLFDDSGFNGAIVKILNSKFYILNSELKIGAGVSMSELLNFAVENSLSGLEWAGGLPGTVGGAVRGNAGAFGGEIKDFVEYVRSYDARTKKFITRDNKECFFGYRNSVFKNAAKNEIIWEIGLRLKLGNNKEIKSSIEEKINYRNKRHPMEYPNAGSVFKNVSAESVPIVFLEKFKSKLKIDPFPVLPTAVLLAEAGLKGISRGGAMISPKHPNFIVNVLNANSEDVKALIGFAKNNVKEKFGIELEEEIVLW